MKPGRSAAVDLIVNKEQVEDRRERNASVVA
jgi:hypothetical protein